MRNYVFGYGSLMSSYSASRTLGRAPTMQFARLAGYRTAWNVASHAHEGNRLGRKAVQSDGLQYDGIIVPIGLEEGDSFSTSGVVFEVSRRELELLDVREVNYDQKDITSAICWLANVVPNQEFKVYTYVPKISSINALRDALANGTKIIVMKSYLELLQDAAREYADVHPVTVPVPEWTVQDVNFQTIVKSVS